MADRPALLRILPFAVFLGIMILDPLLQSALPPGFDLRWLYGLRSAGALLTLALFWSHYHELRGFPSATGTDWLLALGCGLLVFVLWVNLDIKPLAFTAGDGFDPRTGGHLDLGVTLTRLAGAIVIVPIMEELFWRSFILRWLQSPGFLSVIPASIGVRPLLISSVLFATEHRLWFAGLLAGLAYGWLYKRSGNLWVPIVAHALTNALLAAYVLATGSWSFW